MNVSSGPRRRLSALASLLFVTPAVFAQTAVHAPVFDVVSIRPSEPGKPWNVGNRADGYHAIGLPIGVTILNAYLPRGFQSHDRLQGAPVWVWNDPIDFVGSIAPADAAAWERLRQNWNPMLPNPMSQTMLQTALADRCKLVVHRIPAEVTGYALVAGKRPPSDKKLKPAQPDFEPPAGALRLPEGGFMVPIQRGAEPVIPFYGTSMKSLAAELSMLSALPVQDRTGLNGIYDFSLERRNTDREPSSAWNIEDLGLRWEIVKIPTETIVIDSIEKPSPN